MPSINMGSSGCGETCSLSGIPSLTANAANSSHPSERKTTSASVVAELNYWIRNTELAGQERLWYRIYEEFREMGMDEEVVKLVEMASAGGVGIALLAKLGPVDVSLMGLARLHAKEGALVLTTDGELCRECERAGLHASHLRDVTLMVS